MKYSPIPPVILDKRNEIALAKQMAETIKKTSNGKITEVGPDSVAYMLSQGLAFGVAELLYYGSKAPEAWTSEFLRTMGFMRIKGRNALVTLHFTRNNTTKSTVVKSGFRVRTKGGLAFKTLYHLTLGVGQSTGTVLAQAVEVGTRYNVKAKTITIPNTSLNMRVSNPAPAVGGLDEESYRDTKTRAFNAIRKNLIFFDFEVAIKQLLGPSQIIHIPGASPKVHRFDRTNINAPYSKDAEQFFTQLQKYRRATNEEFQVENWMIDRYAQFQKELYEERKLFSYYVLGKTNNSFSLEILEAIRSALQVRLPIGGELLLENARVNIINILIYSSTAKSNPQRYITAFRTKINTFLHNLGLNADLEYNDVVSTLEKVIPINSIKITLESTAKDYGLTSEYRSSEIRGVLGREGLILNGEFSTLSILPNPYYGSAWVLNNLVIEDTLKEEGTYGNLIRCVGSTAERYDSHGGTYTVENDKACIF